MFSDSIRNVNRSWFTLIELLVVIAIIAILAAILLPALNSARARGQTINCLAQQKNISLAMIQYAGDSEEYFPPFLQSSSNINAADSLTWNLALVRPRYLDTPKLYFCPSATDMVNYSMPDSTTSCGTVTDFSAAANYKWQYTTYGYNFVWFGSSRGRISNLNNTSPSGSTGSVSAGDLPPAKTGEVKNPSAKILVADSLSSNPANFDRGYYCVGPGGFIDNGKVADRHNGGANFGFADGHSATLTGADFTRAISGADFDRWHYWDVFSDR